jgi:hypothetical protein
MISIILVDTAAALCAAAIILLILRLRRSPYSREDRTHED